MDGQHKQRWVGVILLLLLAAMLAPFVFRSPEQVRLSLDMEAPEPPPMAPVEAEPAISANKVEQARQRIDADRTAVRESGREAAAREESPEQAGQGEPAPLSGWAVQVASFNQRDNATRLKESLNEAGYTAYQRRVGDGEALHRVYVGPELERADARKLKRRIRLDDAFELDGLVVPYDP